MLQSWTFFGLLRLQSCSGFWYKSDNWNFFQRKRRRNTRLAYYWDFILKVEQIWYSCKLLKKSILWWLPLIAVLGIRNDLFRIRIQLGIYWVPDPGKSSGSREKVPNPCRSGSTTLLDREYIFIHKNPHTYFIKIAGLLLLRYWWKRLS